MKFKYFKFIAALSMLWVTCAQATNVFINEIHYDNAGSDVGEFFEIAAPVGTDLSAWSVVLYNGSNGGTYGSAISLSSGASTQDATTTYVTVTLPANGLQNGSPDGLALINSAGEVVQFLSYEGAFTATNGPAQGMTSEDIGVSEPGTTLVGDSLQLAGTGTEYADFQWQEPQASTGGAVNTGQVFAPSFVPGSVFINEFHYDNAGGDVGEFIEVAAPVGTDLSNWSVVRYNGSNGETYNSALSLSSGTATQDAVTMFVTFMLPANGLQNGSPDGLALIDADGAVSQFISYEGSLTATNGPALGMTSEDIGVSEPGTTLVGDSLQLAGTGSVYSDFTWEAPKANTAGSLNTGQSFGGDMTDEAPAIINSSPANGDTDVASDADITLTFSESVSFGATNAVSCDSEASIPLTITGSDANYTLTPDMDFPKGDSCSLTVSATDVTDLDGTPDNMAGDFTITFTVTANAPIPGSAFINELHYDNAGVDVDELVEIAAPIGSDLNGWTLALYNGNNGAVYRTVELSTGVSTQDAVTRFVTLNVSGIQNGGPDGLALVNNFGAVVQFLSYEGTMTATDGPANGMTSEDIGVSETSSTPIGESLQLAGVGSFYSDFTWQSPQSSTAGLVNIGQSFVPLTGAPVVVGFTPMNGATDVALDTTLSIAFNESVTVTQWPTLSCTVSGEVDVSGDLSGSSFILTPGITLSINETCTFTLPASSVSDIDDTPDTMTADFVSSFSTTAPFICDVPGGVTLISAIQGNSDNSNFQGEDVKVQAVVTAIKPGSSSFFVQEEDADADADPATSEGIMVFNTDPENTPAVGDVVEVCGTVSEFFGLTQISISAAPVVIASDSVLPTPAVFSLPLSATDVLEGLESMRVESAMTFVVTNTFEMGRFSEVQLSSKRLFTPTNVTVPGSAEYAALVIANELDKIDIDDGLDEQNPLLVPFPTGGLSASNTLRLGDTVASLVGIMDYRFNEFKIVPTEEPTFVMSNPRTAEPDLALGNLTVASLNVLNYFNDLDAGPSICGPTGNSGCRGADDNGTDGNGLNEFERQKVKTIAAITAMDADIVGLMEIENDGFGADSSIVDLVDGINAVMGPNTYSIVESDGPIGSDAIVVALIYKPASVSLVGSPLILNSDNSIQDENGPLFNDGRNRPSLIQKFALVENGEEIVISVNHLKSKGSGCGAGDDDATTGQGNCNLTRTRAAQALVAYLDAQFGDTPTLIIGDLNAYALEDPITAITEGAGYTDLANLFGGVDAYSYSFRGQLGYLDHALASPSLLSKVVDTTEWHINADEPTVLDYNLNFKKVENYDNFFAPDAYRMSDHDPVIVSLLLESDAIEGDVNGNGRLDYGDYFLIVRTRGAVVGDDNFIPAADLDNDGVITRTDANLWRRLYLVASFSNR
jgi:predicted extracellular nuclease